jgi:YD repeat-containing protein
VTTFAYTPGGRRQSAQGPHGATAYDYDAAGRLIRVSQPGAGDVQYAYDLLDRVIRIAMPAGAVTYEYDGLGRLVNAGLASGNMTYGYDVAGRLTRVTAPNGVTGAFGHDQRNRLSSLTYEREGQTLASFAYTYTPVGRRASVVEPGATTSYQYDGAGRLLAESRVGMSPYSRQYTYDLAGNRTRLVADGETVGAGRLRGSRRSRLTTSTTAS